MAKMRENYPDVVAELEAQGNLTPDVRVICDDEPLEEEHEGVSHPSHVAGRQSEVRPGTPDLRRATGD